MALAGGRLRVMTTKLSSRSTSSVSNGIASHSFQEDSGHRVSRLGESIGPLAEHPGCSHLVHGSEEHLGGELHRYVTTDEPLRHPFLQDGCDQLEVGRYLVGGGPTEELVALAQLHLHDFGQVGI